MKNILLFLILILFIFINPSYAFDSETSSTNSVLINYSNQPQITLDQNYQQFKIQLINLDNNNYTIPASLLKKKKKSDNLMLYVAGGLMVATGILILTNNPDNFVSNSASDANLGIAIGGTVATGMIVAKFFIDRKR
ncbi:MAG: hypothetical protein A2041_12305 [Bacteroidetes bacterium GWA2_31_9b]|nr:MAG: hypothetical protein A2041_12305 [Bacteroidetes bacterium GWA2_31_9b]